MATPTGSYGGALFGRAKELAELAGMVDAVEAGGSRTLIFSGDAGIGKTALIARASMRAGDQLRVLTGAALPMTSLVVPYQALRAAFRGVEQTELATPFGARGPDPERFDSPLFVDEWLSALCSDRPVLLVIDDLQWSDPGTLDVLMFLIAGPADRPLGIIATVRTDAAASNVLLEQWLTDIRRHPAVTFQTLRPLDRPATIAQIASLLGVQPPQSLVTEVYAHSAGNPYFTRLLLEGVRADHRELQPGFPADLRAAVLRSWRSLPDAARELTRILAIAGRPVDSALLSAVAPPSVSEGLVIQTLQSTVVAGILDLLPDGTYWFHHPLIAEMLAESLGAEERRRWHLAFADAYQAFASQEQLLDAQTAVSMAEHLHIAGRWESAYEWSLLAADQSSMNENWGEALRMARKAVLLRTKIPEAPQSLRELWISVRDAAFRAGHQQAELEAIESLLMLTDSTAEPLETAVLLVRRMHLRMSTGQAFFDASEMEEAVRLTQAQPQSWQHAFALAELTHASLWSDRDAGAELAQAALAAARSSGNHIAMSYALTAASMVQLFAKHPDEAVSLARAGAVEALEAEDYWGYLHAVAWLGNAQESWISERYGGAMREARQELMRRRAPHSYVSKIAADEAASYLAVGSWQQAQTALRIAISLDPGPMGDVSARLTAARLDALQGRPQEAFAHLVRAEDVNSAIDGYINLNFAAIRSELSALNGQPEASLEAAWAGAVRPGPPPTMCEWLVPLAARALADLVQNARDSGNPTLSYLNEVTRLLERFPKALHEPGEPSPLYRRQISAFDLLYAAEICRARGEEDNADSWIQAADGCRDAFLAWEQAYSCLRAAQALLLHGHGRRALAPHVLQRGYHLAAALQAQPLQKDLEQLAAQAKIRLSPAPLQATPLNGKSYGLTARETHVLSHVVAGRTYREIAEALVISEKTVSSHISSLLRKTGASNRLDLARLMLEKAKSTTEETPNGVAGILEK